MYTNIHLHICAQHTHAQTHTNTKEASKPESKDGFTIKQYAQCIWSPVFSFISFLPLLSISLWWFFYVENIATHTCPQYGCRATAGNIKGGAEFLAWELDANERGVGQKKETFI